MKHILINNNINYLKKYKLNLMHIMNNFNRKFIFINTLKLMRSLIN